MDSEYGLRILLFFGTVQFTRVLAQQHRPCNGNCDQACYFEFSKYDANSFLSSGKRSTPRECCHESYCEQQGDRCKTEQYRALIAKKYTCPHGQVVGVTNWCMGHYAHVCTDPCKALQVDRCENGGTCIPKDTAWTCVCRPGFEGTICSIDIDECASVSCNPATSYSCTDMLNDYRCNCKAGWAGKDCMTDINECSSSPCQNSGRCNDHVNGYTCTCPAGFVGKRCEHDIDECASVTCNTRTSNGCIDMINDYKCDCLSGWAGKDCMTDINECLSSPCQNGGTCNDHLDGYTCTCPTGIIGTWCEKDPCKSVSCEHGGTCIPQGTAWTCSCRLGFAGNICHIDIDECAPVTCNTTTSYGCIDMVNDYKCDCKSGYAGKDCMTDINECLSSPCRNGGTCTDHVSGYTCSCIAGFTGIWCEQDIDECASSPCQNNATCHNLLNYYKCECPARIYGVNCDTNICHPTPADVVFVLDSSVSMTKTQFNKQLEFVTNFTKEVKIGPVDFQISVITYSTHVRIEFYLNDFQDNETLLNAIRNISFIPGATFTDKGLDKVKQVFSQTHGIERRINGTMANRFVYLLTDGLSTKRKATKWKAMEIKNSLGVTVIAIGIGNDVSHQELLDVATDSTHVHSVNNFNSLYTVLKRLVYYTCDECLHSAASDVAIMIDTSIDMTDTQFDAALDAVKHIFDVIQLGENGTRVSLTTFSSNIRSVFDFNEITERTLMKVSLNTLQPSTNPNRVPVSTVLKHARTVLFRNARMTARHFLLVFTNGNIAVKDNATMDQEIHDLKDAGINLFVIGSGNDVNVSGLYNLVQDAYNVFITNEDIPMTNLDALQSEFVYDVCDLKGE